MSKIHGACSNTNLTLSSLYYEPWHIRNPDIFIIRGIFRTLEYSKVRRYLHPCQIFVVSFGNSSRLYLLFAKHSFLDHFRYFDIINTPMHL